MGTVEFNSACFYRYANIDLRQLLSNLEDDEQLARQTVEAFIRAAVTAIPTGKQNSMAAHNPPSFVAAVARPSGLWSLANAFVEPVRPDSKADLVANSITRLKEYWGKLTAVYGSDGAQTMAFSLDGTTGPFTDAGSLEKLAEKVCTAITFEKEREL